mmetsp:Transcript_13365/g.42688  ORF Transcript_13365/g.42688 Transcript_13365/m.42688 type:complete len:244 (-) Transcript_13365:355-1086(-)
MSPSTPTRSSRGRGPPCSRAWPPPPLRSTACCSPRATFTSRRSAASRPATMSSSCSVSSRAPSRPSSRGSTCASTAPLRRRRTSATTPPSPCRHRLLLGASWRRRGTSTRSTRGPRTRRGWRRCTSKTPPLGTRSSSPRSTRVQGPAGDSRMHLPARPPAAARPAQARGRPVAVVGGGRGAMHLQRRPLAGGGQAASHGTPRGRRQPHRTPHPVGRAGRPGDLAVNRGHRVHHLFTGVRRRAG